MTFCEGCEKPFRGNGLTRHLLYTNNPSCQEYGARLHADALAPSAAIDDILGRLQQQQQHQQTTLLDRVFFHKY